MSVNNWPEVNSEGLGLIKLLLVNTNNILQWIFEISAFDVITADYTIIISRTLKVTKIMSWSCTSCCFLSVKKQKHDFHFFRLVYNKTIVRFGFCDIQNIQGLCKGYQPQPSASANNPYPNLRYSGYHRNPNLIVLLHTERKKWKSCFWFFTDRKQHKVHELDMITRDLEAAKIEKHNQSCIDKR